MRVHKTHTVFAAQPKASSVLQFQHLKRSLALYTCQLRSCDSGPWGPKQPLILEASNVEAKQLPFCASYMVPSTEIPVIVFMNVFFNQDLR